MAKTLVVLPGWAHFAKSYRKFLAAAPQGYRISIVHYDKVLTKRGVSYVDQLHDYIHSLTQTDYYLFGHSLGGAFALAYADKFPTEIKHLFLTDAEGIPGGENLFGLLGKAFLAPHGEKIRNLLDNFDSLWWMLPHPILHFQLSRFAQKANFMKEAQQNTVPTTILWGENDQLTPLWQGQKLHDLMPSADFQVIPEAVHHWILFQPEKFWDIIAARVE